MDLNIIEYEKMNPMLWNDFIYRNKSGYAYFLYDVIALDRWINDKNISFCIFDDYQNEIVLIAQLHIEERITEQESFYRLHSRWGYVIKDGLSKKCERKVCEKYKEYIDHLYKKYEIRTFDSALPPLTEINYPTIVVANPLMKLGFAPSVRYTWVVELNDIDENILICKCEQTTRQAIRKYKNDRKYIVIESDGSEGDCNIYQNLHEETYIRTNSKESIIYRQYHENIFYNLIPQNICKVFFLKNLETNEYVAATIILRYKNTAYYWWGASEDEREVGINKYLLWESMIRVRDDYLASGDMDDNSFVFECGGAYTYKRRGKFKGLNDFKKCFGFKLHPIYTGMYEYDE